MVSFWPFKANDTSAASFEKVLSQLSAKINKASAQNDRLRLRQRKYKVLWTMYSTFGYIIIAAILVLITGWDRWGALEMTVVAGGPPFIYGVRSTLDTYYSYRVANSESYLGDLCKQRDTSIEKLKAATRYNTTQELLDKYGQKPNSSNKDKPGLQQKPQDGTKGMTPAQRTGFAPPPTANIQRASTVRPVTPVGPPSASPGEPLLTSNTSSPKSSMRMEPGEEFAPNAFTQPAQSPILLRQQSTQYAEGPKWYDRVLDVMLGEDETQAKHRIALICQNCRLVNGQAPPGMRTIEEIGRWRCCQCHAWNGAESEEIKMLRHIAASGLPQESGNAADDEDKAVPAEDSITEDDIGAQSTES